MVKKLFYVLMALLFICAFTITTTPVYAQEEEEEVVVEDVADISLEDLLNVEITTAGRKAEKIGEVPASVVLVTREDIESYGYQTLEEVLENIPGLYFIDDYTSKNFGIRGFFTADPLRNLVVLVNDVRQDEALQSSSYLQQINIPVEAIDRIEVVRGPMSVIYGTGAFFGAINIFTNKVDTEGNAFNQVSAGIGSEKTFKLFARASGTIEDFQYSFNASYFDTAGINEPFADMVANPAILPAYGLAADATTEGLLENSKKYFNFSGVFKWFTVDLSYTEATKDIMIILPPVTEGNTTYSKALRLYFGFSKALSEQVRLDARFGYFLNRMDFDYNFLLPNIYAVQTNASSGYRAEMTMFFNPTPNINITLGAEYTRILDIDNDFAVPFLGFEQLFTNMVEGENKIIQSIFAQVDFKLSERFKFILGARVEQVPDFSLVRQYTSAGTYTESQATYSRDKADFIPRAALIYSINDDNYLKFLYGKAINIPAIFQVIDGVYGPLGFSDLVPEEIQTFELNYIGTWSPKLQVSVSLFYNLLDKLIFRSFFTAPDGTVVISQQNVGEMDTTGAELTIVAKPSEKFTLELSGIYQDTKDKRVDFEEIEVGYSPQFLGYVKASLFLNKDISIALTGSYVDKMESLYDATTSARLGAPTDSYFLLGANLRIRNMFGSGLFLNIRGSNLLDTKIFYPTTPNISWATVGPIGRGMSFLATLGYRFIPMPMP
jgi:outer membrane receptor protein involved in Fe transport